MQYLMDEKEFREKMSEARRGGYVFACVMAQTIDPVLAQKLKDKIMDPGDEAAVENLIRMITSKT